MQNSRLIYLCSVFVIILGILYAGCQNNSAPTMSSDSGLTSPNLINSINTSGNSKTNHHVSWGFWEVIINPETYEVELIPLRATQWHANVVEFMQKPYNPSNLGIIVDVPASTPSSGYFEVDVILTHPFPSLPIFRGFDVRGAFLADGSYLSKYDPSARLAHPDPAYNEARLLNADGYMRWFNPIEFNAGINIMKYIPAKLGTVFTVTSTLNPYKYFSDDFVNQSDKGIDLQQMNIDPDKRGTFSPGKTITRRYKIQFPVSGTTPIFKFTYVIDASYHDPNPGDPSYPVSSYPLSANMQEVYKIVCTNNNSTAYYKDSSKLGGTLRFNLELFDWQAPVNPSGVPGEIGKVIVESPTLLSGVGGMIDLTDTFKNNAVAGTVTSSVVSIEIPDVTPTGTENQVLFFTVTSADPDNYGNPFNQPYPQGKVLSAYYMWKAPILSEPVNNPPVVGQVSGPTNVNPSMPPQKYTAPVSDPDVGQTLTAMWSVVEKGNAPNYTIPSNPDFSVDINWALYAADKDYDVNIRVNDGYDSVEGSLLVVTNAYPPNTPPTVGPVSGPTPVTVANTNSVYTAPINDPDAWQTLTVKWSVVPTGNSPNYNINAQADKSLLQNWSTYPVGQYDVNVQVNDGFAPPVEGTKLIVTLNNTAPTLGAITGPTNVNETNKNSQYNPGSLTDPDVGQTHTYMWSLVPSGSPASFTLPPNGPGNSLIVNWCNYSVGQYDIQCRVNDGYANGTSPVLGVTRTFSTCVGTAHIDYSKTTLWPRFSYYPYVPPGWPPSEDPIVLDSYMLPRMDMDFFTRGKFAGQGVIQAGNAVLMNFIADSTGMKDPPTLYKWRIPGMSFYQLPWTDNIACSPRVVLSLDVSPDLDDTDGYEDNRIVMVTSHRHDRIYVLDADKPCPQNNPPFDDPPPMTILTNVLGAREIPCIAIDKNNGIWALVLNAASQYMLHHWTYVLDTNSGGPYYTYVAADTINLTTQLGSEIDVFDMVVAYANNYLYIFERGTAPVRGRIHRVNLNTSPPTYLNAVNNIFSSTIGTSEAPTGNPYIYTYRDDAGGPPEMHSYNYGGDILIDHVGFENCDPEHCRIEAIANLASGGVQVVRLDLNLNILNRQSSAANAIYLCAGLSSYDNVGDRILLCPPYQIFSLGTYEYYFSYWAAPSDW